MPRNKNAETRYRILDRLLANRYQHYSTEDLRQLVNEELEDMDQPPVSLRTIVYDLNYLEHGPFMADIEHYQIDEVSRTSPDKTAKKNCHRYRDRSFSIYQQKLTDDEKYLLGEAISLLGQFDGLPNLDGLERLRTSLNVRSQRQILALTKNPLEKSNLLGELFTAISQRVVVRLDYHRFHNPDGPHSVVVYPYLLKEYNRRWWLFAAAEETGKLLNFALDQIDRVEMLPTHRYVDCASDITERFEDIIGVTLYEERPLQEVVFWVSDVSVDYVRTKPLHDSQRPIRGERADLLRQQYPSLEGGAFFAIECIENYELIRELTLFGCELLVLSPAGIRAKVIDRISAQYQAYQSLY